MKYRYLWGCGLVALLSSVVFAQDSTGSRLKQQFLQTVQLGGTTAKAPRSKDARLNTALVDRLSACYEAETHQTVSETEHNLLTQYAPELTMQFATPLAQLGCELSGHASEDCIAKLSQLDCEPLAVVIRAQGWDRAPSPAMEAAIAKYTQRLSGRYVACQSGEKDSNEETTIREEHLAMSMAVQISMLLTTGQCSLQEAGLQDCFGDIAAPKVCDKLTELAKHSRLPRFCPGLLDCSAEPAIIDQIAN
jgi:hypothetical protein